MRKHLEHTRSTQMKWRAFSIHTFWSNKRRTTKTMNKYVQKKLNKKKNIEIRTPSAFVRARAPVRDNERAESNGMAKEFNRIRLGPILHELWIKWKFIIIKSSQSREDNKTEWKKKIKMKRDREKCFTPIEFLCRVSFWFIGVLYGRCRTAELYHFMVFPRSMWFG